MTTNNAIVPGSISAIAAQTGQGIAETFLSADTVVIVDVSGSMATSDSKNMQSRYEVACQELARLQQSLPGKVAVIAFSDDVQFCPGGKPFLLGGGTALDRALEFVKIADGTVSFVVVSDGEPDNPDKCLQIAKGFKSRIDTIFVGPESDIYGGSQFLQQLANVSGGQYVVAAKAQELAQTVERLMLR